ncbi:MAG: hypothetical protein AVDCRST_MAG34-2340, partial [uncultured Nocardioidaceae bacterium]
AAPDRRALPYRAGVHRPGPAAPLLLLPADPADPSRQHGVDGRRGGDRCERAHRIHQQPRGQEGLRRPSCHGTRDRRRRGNCPCRGLPAGQRPDRPGQQARRRARAATRGGPGEGADGHLRRGARTGRDPPPSGSGERARPRPGPGRPRQDAREAGRARLPQHPQRGRPPAAPGPAGRRGGGGAVHVPGPGSGCRTGPAHHGGGRPAGTPGARCPARGGQHAAGAVVHLPARAV